MAETDARPGPVIAPFASADLDQVVALNEAAVPAVNSVAPAFFRNMLAQSDAFLTARLDGRIAGFLLLLPAGIDYASLNYRWFSARYADFLYVDRIVVSAAARRRGLARAFYDRAWRRCRSRGVGLACEVNVKPPNPESMAFHRACGFREVGRQDTEGGDKTVSLMMRDTDV